MLGAVQTGPNMIYGPRFFFQAEDGIRDLTVTGVQTCALPISLDADGAWSRDRVVPAHEILERIDAVFPLEQLPMAGAHHNEHVEPAERFRYADEIGRASCRERV